MRDEEITDIIWSPYISGHHPMYLRVLLEAMEEVKGHKVIIAVGSGIVDDPRWLQIAELIGTMGAKVILLDYDADQYTCDCFSGQIKQRNMLVSLLRKLNCNRLYIPYCDSIWLSLYLLGMPAGICMSLWLLWMRNQSHLSANLQKRAVERLKLRSAAYFMRKYNAINYTVDPCFYMWSARRPRIHTLFRYIPEPVNRLVCQPVPVSRSRDNGKDVVVLAIGMLDDRKDITRLIDAFAGYCSDRLQLRLVGTLSDELLIKIDQQPSSLKSRIYVHNATVSDGIYCDELRSADVVWNVQTTHLLSSGTLAHAMACGSVVICSSSGCSGYWSNIYSNAVIYTGDPLLALTQAISKLNEGCKNNLPVAGEQLQPFTLSWADYV